jgi:predicted ATPase/DNA-binding SARP family transcriptional activator
LGPLEVRDDGGPIAVTGARRRALLLRFLLSANQAVSAERLVEDLWDGAPPGGARSTLASHVSLLRGVLGPRRIRSAAGGYLLRVDAGELDVISFEAGAAAGAAAVRRGDPASAVRHLGDALGRWRGPAWADVAERPWAAGEAARLTERRRAALDDLLRARLELGQHHELVADAEMAVSEEPLREQRWATLMFALYRSGRQADALRAFQRLRSVLGEELGIEPSAELVALEDAILQQKPELSVPPTSETAMAARGPSTPAASGPVEPLGHNLPEAVGPLLGRSDDLTEVGLLLSGQRIVTVTGVGGVGKTRFALEVARRAFAAFRDGVWLVELAAVSDPVRVPEALAEVLHPSGDASRPVLDRLVDSLNRRCVLLVLDNCEHLVAACASTTAALVSRCPQLVVLTTSREPLRVGGERTHRLEPLALPPVRVITPRELDASPAVALFVERARAQRRGLDVQGPDGPAVASICRRLDGLPLALELAAARAGSMALAELDARLADRFRWVADGRRDVAPRQQTLWATIDWSYSLLDGREQAVLRRLSVFVGGCTLDAATEVCASGLDPEDVRLAVPSLVDKSLVVADHGRGTVRYRLLETIREFAALHLVEHPDESTTAHERHTAYFRRFAAGVHDRMRRPDAARLLGGLVVESDNLYAMLQRLWFDAGRAEDLVQTLVDLDDLWAIYPSDGHRLYEASSGQLERVGPALRSRALLSSYEVGIKVDESAVQDRLVEAARLASIAGEERLQARIGAVAALEAVYWDAPGAGALVEEAIERARAFDDVEMVSAIIRLAPEAVGVSPDDVAAECLALARRSGHLFVLTDALSAALHSCLAQGDLAGARWFLQELTDVGASALFPEDGYGACVAGHIEMLGGDVPGAVGRYVTALRQSLRAARPAGAAMCATGLAVCAERLGDDVTAARLHGYAMRRAGPGLTRGFSGALRAQSIDCLRRHVPDFETEYGRGEAMSDAEIYDLVTDVLAPRGQDLSPR